MRLLQLHSDFIEYEPTAKEIKRYLDTVKSNRVLIYPYAHLSSNLASPKSAFELIKSVEKNAKESLDEVYRAPFGWTKSFGIKVKGHPLAESAKVLTKQDTATSIKSEKEEGEGGGGGEEEFSSALKAEEKLQSFWYI